ncbi:MAG TPA: hydrogenase maturation nickel metallochaperone HypA [Chloroflexaceae bacterium]|nr:hydrogenase maturation nickel metallochaperone HypA [Chloroflexaceae bacterium]
MHELSIAISIVELAEGAARAAGAVRVTAVHLRLGALSGVVREALEFSFPLAAQGTALEDAPLVIEELPLVVACAPCGRDVRPEGLGSLSCPLCGTPSATIRQGRELELAALEAEDQAPSPEVPR